MRSIHRLSCLCFVLTLLSLHGCNHIAIVKSTETRTQSTAHVQGTQLVVQGVNGSIDIIAEPDRDDVHIAAEITAGGSTKEVADQRLAETVLSVTRDTNRVLTVTTEFPKPSTNGDGANLIVRIPAASNVHVTTVNGAVTVTGIQASMTLNTTNGRVTVHDSAGEASITTVNGSITLERHVGDVSARTTNGSITMDQLDGSVHVNTVNGRVSVALTGDSTGPLQLFTTNGRIEATVGAAFAGEIDATTSNGSITINDEAGLLKSQVTDRRRSKVAFAQEGPASTLRTSNGRITVTTN